MELACKDQQKDNKATSPVVHKPSGEPSLTDEMALSQLILPPYEGLLENLLPTFCRSCGNGTSAGSFVRLPNYQLANCVQMRAAFDKRECWARWTTAH